MQQIALVNNQQPTMSSREIADLVESRHDSVKRTIDRLSVTGVVSFTPSVETSHQGSGARDVEVYLVNKRDSYVIVAQLCPQFTARLVDRWQELESGASAPRELTRLELLQIAMDSEQKRITAEAERDHAIATKAQIGNRREATAMATASAAVKKVKRLEGELGRNQKHATIIAVERATGKKLAKNAFVSLRQWCKANGHTAVDVVDARYGTVKAWPAAAWLAAYGIDLCGLFATNGGEQ